MKHDNTMHDAALLLARSVLGASIAAHGAQKLFGWFGGPGPEKAEKMFGSLGFQPASTMARVASITELTAGTMIATGAGGPIGSMLLVSVMTVAAGSVHFKNGYFQTNQGFELNTMYALVALLLAVENHGRYSVDEATGMREKMRPWFGWLAVAAGLGSAAFILSRREAPPTEATPASRTETGTVGQPAEKITPVTQ